MDFLDYWIPGALGGTAPVPVNTFVQVAFTRDPGGTITGYVDGVESFNALDDDATSVISPDDFLHFFRDDLATEDTENAGGAVARIRLFDGALTSEEVADLDRLPVGDSDADGVVDDVDFCTDTVIPESVPTNNLGVNRWALVDEDGVFDTTPPPGGGNGPDFNFTVEDTRGCSCEQIIEAMALGWGHTKFGCSTGAMLQWIDLVWNKAPAQSETESQPNAGGLQTLDGGGDDPFASGSGNSSDTGMQRQPIRPRRQAPRRDNRED
jgi:hypothetical protein